MCIRCMFDCDKPVSTAFYQTKVNAGLYQIELQKIIYTPKVYYFDLVNITQNYYSIIFDQKLNML